jgi:hypothetical protein
MPIQNKAFAALAATAYDHAWHSLRLTFVRIKPITLIYWACQNGSVAEQDGIDEGKPFVDVFLLVERNQFLAMGESH